MRHEEFDVQIKHDFMSEAMELISMLEDLFLKFEQNPEDSDVVNSIFRMAHTIKGSAMICGFNQLGAFAHLMETLLVKIREGHHWPDSDTVEILLRANDTLRNYINALAQDFGSDLDAEQITQELNLLIGPDQSLEGSLQSVSVAAFGFFDDEPVAEPISVQTPPDDLQTVVLDDLSFLCLKAYLNLSHDQSPEGIDSCLRTLEEATTQLRRLRCG